MVNGGGGYREGGSVGKGEVGQGRSGPEPTLPCRSPPAVGCRVGGGEGTGRSKRIKLSRQKGRELVNASANLNFCLNPPFYQNDVRHSVTFGRQT